MYTIKKIELIGFSNEHFWYIIIVLNIQDILIQVLSEIKFNLSNDTFFAVTELV